jgi:hypothetical protein
MPDTSQNNRLEKREALDLALFHKLTSGDPESFVSQFFVLLAHVMKHSSNGSQPPQLGELAAYLAELKKSEALRTSQAPEIRKYLEQLNATQGDILKRLRTLPASPAGGDTWGKRLAWQVGIGLGILLIGFLLGTLIESRKENDRLTSVIGSLPYSMQAPALLQSHGGGIGITSDGGQLVMSCGDLPDPWISTDHKHAVISLR